MKKTIIRNRQQICSKFKKLLIENGLLIFEIVMLASICILYAISISHYADFYPINGTFQNYNPVRRMLDGQIPYRDFCDYLGMGHLYLGSIVTFFLGGSYKSSLIAFSFLTFSSLVSISLMISKSLFKKWTNALGITIVLALLIITKPLFFVHALEIDMAIENALNSALGAGNSARFVRGYILPISVALYSLFLRYWEKNSMRLSQSPILKFAPSICAGIIAGISFLWSNDYGISCFVCICIMVFLVFLLKNKKVSTAVLNATIELITSVVSLIVFGEIFTLGHFSNWAQDTFGTGGYQSWYYNSDKSYYIFDVDFSYIMLLQAFIVVTYLVLLYRERCSLYSIRRYGIPCFANMVGFCAVNEYHLLSGGYSREVALTVLFFTIVYESIRLLANVVSNIRLKQSFLIVMCVMSLSWGMSTAKNELLFHYIEPKEGQYIESMGGHMTSLYHDLQSASEFLNGEKLFSTYASGQEVYENQFQPSGIDYIIHVLGDEQRREYMEAFRKSDFRYVATINKNYNQWEYWVERANWFFYRELYRNWHPVYANSYELYWERNKENDEYTVTENVDLMIEHINDTTVKLIVKADEGVEGYADILIDYSVEKRKGSELAQLLIQRNLKVTNAGMSSANDPAFESNYLRKESSEYIPMSIHNGYGELILTSQPEQCTNLNFKHAECKAIYTSFYTYTE